MSIIDCREISENIYNKITTDIKNVDCIGLAIIRVGEKSDQIYYEKILKNKAFDLGIKVYAYSFKEKCNEEDLIRIINICNKDKNITGIIILQPLPSFLDTKKIINSINREKDIELIKGYDISKDYLPCTAEAVIEIIDYLNIDKSSKIVVIGRSPIVGKPTIEKLKSQGFDVDLIHSKTKYPKEKTKDCDVIISCIGKAEYIDESYIKDGAILIDVGVNIDRDKKITGDFNENALSKSSMYTKVPGGVGLITTAVLFRHLLKFKKENAHE